MRHIDITQLPNNVKKLAEDNISPSNDNYFILMESEEGTKTGVVDTKGGEGHFGKDEWEMIVGGFHPEISCLVVDVVLH